jgi:hypothetical protein
VTLLAAAVDWSTVTLPAAFVIGALVGTIVTMRVTRSLLDYLRREQREAGKR